MLSREMEQLKRLIIYRRGNMASLAKELHVSKQLLAFRLATPNDNFLEDLAVVLNYSGARSMLDAAKGMAKAAQQNLVKPGIEEGA